MSPLRQRLKLAAVVIGAVGGGGAYACGPFFPETILDQSGGPLRPPIVDFESEVRQLPSPSQPPEVAKRISEPTSASQPMFRDIKEEIIDPEIAELSEILVNLPQDQRDKIVGEYAGLRAAMLCKFRPFETWDVPVPEGGYDLFAQAELGHWPEGLPPDILLYLEGALRYNYDDKAGAIAIWKRLLALPADERRNRSVAAAWMIAKATRETEGLGAAQSWYLLCQQLSTDGFRDCLHLGLSSLGWQARYALDRDDRRKALELYYHQAMAGDPLGWSSLGRALPDVSKLSDDALAEMVKDPFHRGLMTAMLLRQNFSWSVPEGPAGEESQAKRWLSAIERGNIAELAEAARFAELAYSTGDFETAKRWLQRAPANNPQALWLRGKLALKKGDVRAAQKYLSQAEQGFPRDFGSSDDSIRMEGPVAAQDAKRYRISQFYGDLGAANLGCDKYIPALTALYKGSYFTDAAYVSERVLSAEELLAYTRNHFPTPTGPWKERYSWSIKEPSFTARYILARRLAREGYFKNARAFFPSELVPVFDRYVALLSESKRSGVSKTRKADALWEAAQIHRALGMEIFGTEAEPDAAMYDGNFPAHPTIAARLGLKFEKNSQDYYGDFKLEEIVPRPTADERARVKQSKMRWEERFQYRYAAADMAWWAARLMPNNSEHTAEVLGIAGIWLKRWDPQAADRFYKSMIWRNWSTSLAREADKLRWFPDISWEYDPFAAAHVPRPEGL